MPKWRFNNCSARIAQVKVLHVIASVDPRGGGPIEGVFASSEVWLKHGHERHILCLDSPDAPWVHKSPVITFAAGVRNRWWGIARPIIPWLRYGYTPHLTKWLRRYAQHYDAIIINGLWNYASYGSWRALRHLNVPYFVFTHGMLDPWFAKAYPKKHFVKSLFWKLFERQVLRDARGVLFTCEEEKQLAPLSFSPYECREFVVGYGTQDILGDPDEQRAAFFRKVPEARGRKLILFLSRIHPKKAVDLLIRGFARHAGEFPEVDLVIAGPDQVRWQAELMKLAAELGIAKRTYWPGMLTGNEKWGAFRSAEFFVLPSHQENFGVVVAEAMALAVPVLISNKVNIWREVQADGGGLIVVDEIDEIANGLRYMCSLPRSELEVMGRKGRSCFMRRYDLKNNAMELLNQIAQLIAADLVSTET
jgi:glycosyltransferase involved in cell wall biosynthesis